MPTYARDKETWHIVLDGSVFHITVGGKKTTRKFVSPVSAQEQYDKAIKKQIDAGFVLLPEGKAAADEMMAPDDLEALAVHADHLQERGHFLGEVIAAQLELHKLGEGLEGLERAERGERETRRTELATEARSLLTKHHEALFFDFARHAVSIVPKGPREATGQYAACTASWRLGVIDEVALAASSKVALLETIPALARLNLGRFVRSIVCGSSAPPSERYAQVEYDRFVVTLAEHAEAFPRLRSLFLGDLGEGRVARLVGELDPIYDAFPLLEVLRIHADDVASLGSIGRLTKLREIELVGRCATPTTLRLLCESGLSESLTSIIFDTRSVTGDLETALTLVSEVPKLQRLGLLGWGGKNKVACLLRFKGLSKLKELDLSHNQLATDGGSQMKALVANAARFAHLEKLDLRFNDFTSYPALFRELRTALPHANFAGQSSDLRPREDRYDEIDE